MAPLNLSGQRRSGPPLTPLGAWLLLATLLLLLVALALILGGCAVSYDAAGGYRGVLGCVNFTGPGFTLACPENVQAPQLPDTNKPPSGSANP